MNLQQLIKDACEVVENSDNVNFNNKYSGRGMYGSYCIGIVGRQVDVQQVITQVALSIMEESIEGGTSDGISGQVFCEAQTAMTMLLAGQGTDSMGRDVIIYWPTLKPIQE